MNLDIGILIVYLLLVLGFGVSFYFKKRTASEFTSGGGRLPSWALGMSVFATYVSSISFLALPGSAYGGNWGSFVFSLSIPLAAYIAVKYFVPLYRGLGNESAFFYLEQRFGYPARTYASTFYLLTQLARMGTILYLLALPMQALLGWSIPEIIIATGIVVILYASLGGLEAVVWTDAIQGVILIFGALICVYILISSLGSDFNTSLVAAQSQGKLSLGSLKPSLVDSSFWLILFYGLFINLQNFGVDQNYIQRYVSAKSDKDAAKSIWLGSLLYVPVSLLFFIIGTLLWMYYQQNEGILPSDIPSDQIFPFFIVNQLPTGLTGLLLAAIFSAGMSSISTSINSSATVLLSDFYKRNKKRTEGQSKGFLVLSSAGMGILSVCIALMFNGVESVLDTWWALASIFSGGVLGLFLVAFLFANIRKRTAYIAMLLGFLSIVIFTIIPLYESSKSLSIHPNFIIIIGTCVTVLFAYFLRKSK